MPLLGLLTSAFLQITFQWELFTWNKGNQLSFFPCYLMNLLLLDSLHHTFAFYTYFSPIFMQTFVGSGDVGSLDLFLPPSSTASGGEKRCSCSDTLDKIKR
jgi:hypothetical protein